MELDLQKTLTEAITYLDQERAREVLSAIAKNPNIQVSPEDLLRLNYLRLTSLNEERVLDLIKQSILTAYTIDGYSLEQKLIDYIEQLDYVPFVMDFVVKLKKILEDHQERLGTKQISVNGRNVEPSIANWLADYIAFGQKASRDALLQLKYVNSAPNVKSLNAPEKQVLQNLIGIYDHLSRYVETWESIPDDLPPEEQELLGKKIESMFDAAAEAEVVADLPQPVTPREPSMDISSGPAFQIPLQKNLDLSTRQRSGLVFDQTTNVDLNEESRLRAEEKRNQLAIQDKLEALKKRSGPDTENNS